MAALELTSDLLVELGGWAALKEARGLVERGKVTGARCENAIVSARVQSPEKVYEPRIVLAERISQVEVRCTCVESRKSGRVCAHALAAGWAVLHPPARALAEKSVVAAKPSVGVEARPSRSTPSRWVVGEASREKPGIECTILLPLQLGEAFGQPTLRIILEARRDDAADSLPWDAVTRELAGFAVSEDDARVLDALKRLTGGVAGINLVAREKVSPFLRSLSGHPRIWLGKKQQIVVRRTAEEARVRVTRRPDGALELISPSLDRADQAPGMKTLLPGWRFDGKALEEIPQLPKSLGVFPRVIARDRIADFLTHEWPELERNCEVEAAEDLKDFILETGQPKFEARLEGALSGLTLNLFSHYGEKSFELGREGSAHTNYFADSSDPNRFWRRDLAKEGAALAQIKEGGFNLVRSGTATFSLIQENHVARFLANTLPRWRRSWTVNLGSRLQATLEKIDFAEPEFSLRPGSGENWFSLDLKLSIGGQPVPLAPAEIQRWLQTGQSHARLASQRILLVPTEAWGEMREVLAECDVDQEPGRMRLPRTYAPFLSSALSAQGFRAAENNVGQPPVVEVKTRLDPKLFQQLRPYQIAGVEWLARLASQRFSALLADDMGLGKTLQALAFSAWLRAGTTKAGPVLVVCPTSLVENWLREAARFVPHLRTLDLTGTKRAERWDRAAASDLIVTSYAILRRDAERYQTVNFSLVILDEAQHIKNRGSQNAQAAKALRSPQRLILTGTPLENSILDLWSLFDFLLPGYLGTATEFRDRYETPLTRGVDARAMERLRHRIGPFFLRRKREEVLTELPPRLEFPTLCELSDEQREVYRAILAQGRREVFERSGKAGQGRDRIAVLTTLLRLRQVCCHLDLLPAGEEKRAWREPSAKLERTFELIDEAIDGGHRVLLFSQFVRALHLLRDEAKKRDLPFAYLDGQTVERQAEVDRFQRDVGIPLFLISLKAGGTGLNLTGADTVIHFDPWWNPAVEEQATARAHRMGQARTVQSYKLIAAGTVEEKIQALQARKRELFQASVGSDEAFVKSLTGEELEEMLAE